MSKWSGFIYLFLLFFLFHSGLFALSVPEFQWVLATGGDGFCISRGFARDSNGYFYITGEFYGTIEFGNTILDSENPGIFIAKVSPLGEFIWVKEAGGPYVDRGYSIDIDSYGNSYVIGTFTGTANFGHIELVSNGDWDIFITKLSSNGDFVWAKQAGGSMIDIGFDIKVDSSCNAYITGSFGNSAYFDDMEYTASGMLDIFVAKLDMNGNFLWVNHAEGSSTDFSYSIDIDNSGNCFITGSFSQNLTFGNITLNSGFNRNIFIAKLDGSGNCLWAKQSTGNADFTTGGYGITIDNDGNSYISGSFYNYISFGDTELSTESEGDIFIAKLDPDGNFLWAVQGGGSELDIAFGIISDNSGNLYSTGYFHDTAVFGDANLVSTGNRDIFISSLDTEGNFIWTQKAGGIGSDISYDIIIDNVNNIYITGSFEDTAYFGDLMIDSDGEASLFIAKIGDRQMEGPDASILYDDIVFHPSSPQPGDTIEITAKIHNIGTQAVESGIISFYHSFEPNADLQIIDSSSFGTIEPGAYTDITVYWATGEDYDPVMYVITVILDDIMPFDIDLSNNITYIELGLPIELAYFSAFGFNQRAEIRWLTMSESDNLGFNLYRVELNPFNISFPVKLNDSIIPGQGTSSCPHLYTFTDHNVSSTRKHIYILESVSVYGEMERYRTYLQRLGIQRDLELFGH